MLAQYGIELFYFETIGMILSIFFRVIMMRTLRALYFNETTGALSLSHFFLQYLLLLDRQHAAGKKFKYTVLPL